MSTGQTGLPTRGTDFLVGDQVQSNYCTMRCGLLEDGRVAGAAPTGLVCLLQTQTAFDACGVTWSGISQDVEIMTSKSAAMWTGRRTTTFWV